MNFTWYENFPDLTPLLEIAPEKTIILDTETTGLNANGKDEILQLSIIDGNGKELFNSYIKPTKRKTWSDAEERNGITPAMVKKAPFFTDVYNEVQDIFESAELLVGYNLEFDLDFLKAVDIKFNKDTYLFDVMKEYAPVNGNYDEYKGDYKWCNLTACARNYGYRFKAHDSLEDAKATRHCYYAMLKDEEGYLDLVKKNADNKNKANENSQEKEKKVKSTAYKETRSYKVQIKICKIIGIIIGGILVAFSLLGFLTYQDDTSVFFVTLIPGLALLWLCLKKKKKKSD